MLDRRRLRAPSQARQLVARLRLGGRGFRRCVILLAGRQDWLPEAAPASRLTLTLRLVGASSMNDYLLPIADGDALIWIVSEQRTALPPGRTREADAVRPGDRLFLYTTRGCFRNPTRDRGRVIGCAAVTEGSRRLPQPIQFGRREYSIGLRFRIGSLAPIREGVELAPLVNVLATFPEPSSWSARLRRALVPLAEGDGDLLLARLQGIVLPYRAALKTYV